MFSFAAAVTEWLRRADRHRNAVLAALLAKASVEAAVGLPTSRAAMVALVLWLLAGLVVGRLMTRVSDPARAARLRCVILTADVAGVALLQYLSGGTAWFGAMCYVFLIIVSAVAMRGWALAYFTALSAVAYGVPLFGEAFGLLRPYPLVGAPSARAAPAQAFAVWTVAAVVLAGTAAVLYGFVRLVRRGAEWHEQLVDQAPMIVIRLGRDGRVLSANPAADAAAAARGDGPMAGRHYRTLVSPDAHAAMDAVFEGALAGSSRHAVVPSLRPDGSCRYMDVLTHPVREHGARDGAVVGVLGLVRDVTEQHTAAAELEAREARFRALAQHASDVTCVVDAAGHYTYLSPSTRRVFGRAPEALLARPVVADLHPEDLAAVRDGMRRARRAPGQPVTLHYRCRHADGSWRQIESVGCALLDEPAVRGYVFNSRDVTERAELEAQLTRQAFHDALTGLPNRARFGERLGAALARARAEGDAGQVAVLVLDLDGFKVVNDSLGHAAGDRLLVEVAARLLAATRGCDTVARLGGDEFAVLLEGVQSDADATVVAERVVAALRPGFSVDGRQAYVGTSVGIARAGVHAEPGGPAEDPVAAVMRDADAAMYRAKARGKGRWALFEPAMHAAAVERLALEGDLRLALERDELTLVYQPVVELDTGRTVAAEALVRWRHPRRGLVGPAEFIPFAEETGLIVR
jgi:diguanylate cyclase (GGDEF)-like protein/PAS domain S-box-containing protein